jgi:integrase/recombinase XerD
MDGQISIAQRTFQVGYDNNLLIWADNFLKARKSENLSPGTIRFYSHKLALFQRYCDSQMISNMSQITTVTLRDFLCWLESTGHNPGGQHAAYRTVKTFLKWYWEEVEPDYKNPIEKVRAPRVPELILPPITLEDAGCLLDVCNRKTFSGVRDQALILVMLDTGARASEVLGLEIADFDGSGEFMIQSGKGNKSRVVFVSERTRRALRQYLRKRDDRCPALFISQFGERLKYAGLRAILTRLAKKAGLKDAPTAHQFRRAFALETLRAGGDLFTLQKQMGHADLSVLKQYLKLTNEDLRAAHARTSPVDRLKR